MKAKVNTDVLPEATAPSTPGTNGLFRLNYFNGRYLTAEALRREQIYGDYRARLVAEIHPSGIAWGLGLDVRTRSKKAWPPPADVPAERGIECADLRVTLQPGLAFNGVGRPIAVGAPFDVDLQKLLDMSTATRFVVVDGGTQFAPCVCLAPALPGPSGGASLSPGPYLLVIQAVEKAEGEAKIYGNVCGTAPPKLCEADGWRGGFALSLARLPVEVPFERARIRSAWDLRGVLSAYYFDVYEHSLRDRWLAPFPRGEGDLDFCDGLGPFDRQDGAVPLAMVYVGSEGTILFLDPWIPRRPIAATASTAWAANVRGAPTPSACIARVHQFQCQLAESLAVDPFVKGEGLNLFERGFRHIPPWGLLPVPAPRAARRPTPLAAAKADAEAIRDAEVAARAYFRDTNVFAYGVVAVHDDDILEDMIRAMEKDPIELRACDRDAALDRRTLAAFLAAAAPRARANPQLALLYAILLWIARTLRCCGELITMDRLINREIEIVKLMVPMHGLRRVSPAVQEVRPDRTLGLPNAWYEAVRYRRDDAELLRFIEQFAGPAAEPHGFVFYVKQRLVLLDALYLVVDALLDFTDLLFRRTEAAGAAEDRSSVLYLAANSLQPVTKRQAGVAYADTTAARTLAEATSSKVGPYAASVLADADTRAVAVGALRALAPELSSAPLWKAYDAERQRIHDELVAEKTAPDEAATLARDRAIEVMLREHAGFGALKLAAIFLPAEGASSFESALREDAAGGEGAATVAGATLYAKGYAPVRGARAEALLDAARVAYGERDLAAVGVRGAPAGLTLNDVLATAPAALPALVRGADPAGVVRRIQQQGDDMTAAVTALGSSARFAAPAFWSAFDAAADKHPGKLGAALQELASHGRAEEDRAIVKQLERLHTVLGEQGTERFLAAARVQGKQPSQA